MRPQHACCTMICRTGESNYLCSAVVQDRFKTPLGSAALHLRLRGSWATQTTQN